MFLVSCTKKFWEALSLARTGVVTLAEHFIFRVCRIIYVLKKTHLKYFRKCLLYFILQTTQMLPFLNLRFRFVIVCFSGNLCPLGDRCTNKRFQKSQFAPVEVFRTEKKGLGIRASADIPL